MRFNKSYPPQLKHFPRIFIPYLCITTPNSTYQFIRFVPLSVPLNFGNLSP